MINRDERPENRTDLREEAHRGSVRLFKAQVISFLLAWSKIIQ